MANDRTTSFATSGTSFVAKGSDKTDKTDTSKDTTSTDLRPTDPYCFGGSALWSNGATGGTNHPTPKPTEPDSRAGKLIPDAGEMKRKVRANMIKKQYDVHDFYKHEGCAQKIARDHRFEKGTLAVIVLNALYMWIDADYNHHEALHEANIVFQIAENAFCIFFTCELTIRFLAFQRKTDCCRDAWFAFDFFLVFIMVVETWIMSYVLRIFGLMVDQGHMGSSGIFRLFRLLRLTRMSRMARLLRSVPELMILLKGMAAATTSCIFTALLLVISMFVWALALKQLGSGEEFVDKYFPNIPRGMYTLMMSGCFFKDFGVIMEEVKRQSMPCCILYFCFVVFSGVAIMKMLTGMLCKVINAVSASETEKMTVGFVKDELVRVLIDIGHCEVREIHAVDTENLMIAHSVFCEMLNDSRAQQAFHKIGVDPVGLVGSVDFIFPEETGGDQGNQIPFADFMDALLQLRGTNAATVKDIVEIRKFIRSQVREVSSHLSNASGEAPRGMRRTISDMDSYASEHSSPDQQQDGIVTGPSFIFDEIVSSGSAATKGSSLDCLSIDEIRTRLHQDESFRSINDSTLSPVPELLAKNVPEPELTAEDVFKELCDLSETERAHFFCLLSGYDATASDSTIMAL